MFCDTRPSILAYAMVCTGWYGLLLYALYVADDQFTFNSLMNLLFYGMNFVMHAVLLTAMVIHSGHLLGIFILYMKFSVAFVSCMLCLNIFLEGPYADKGVRHTRRTKKPKASKATLDEIIEFLGEMSSLPGVELSKNETHLVVGMAKREITSHYNMEVDSVLLIWRMSKYRTALEKIK
ncbi:uncharacterized protein LOC135399003 isoform X2 [Ornithodoros turicata]|uniref:uncharacterized protein LOC135399003 isoform X2 n=1 Tax=Ornithodoros turicata TaxID=34597 RepID=UPI003139E63E